MPDIERSSVDPWGGEHGGLRGERDAITNVPDSEPSSVNDTAERIAFPAIAQERDDALAQVAKLGGAVVDAVLEQERLRQELRTAARRMRDAHALLTPGMKAGTGEARQILSDAAGHAITQANAS